MFFPVAHIEILPWIPPVVAFVISLLTSMGGVSGAFLLLPFQMSVLGFDSPAVTPTNHLFNVVAIPGGVWRYAREGRMFWPLTGAIIAGTFPGVWMGAWIRIRMLSDPRDFKLFVGLVLLFIGVKLAVELRRKLEPGDHQALVEGRFHQAVTGRGISPPPGDWVKVTVREWGLRRLVYRFCGQTFSVRVPRLLFLSLAVGMIGGIYGIGGGAIIAPFLVTFFKIPVYITAGAALLATFVTSVAGVAFYHLMAPFYPGLAVSPDWALGLLFGVGGLAGMYCGAGLQKFVPAKIVKSFLALCIMASAIGYIQSSLRWFL